MSIKAKLLLSTLSELLLIVLFSTFLVVSSRQTSTITTNQNKAAEIAKAITDIRFVTFENLLHHDQRSYDQWQTKHVELALLLKSYPASRDTQEAILIKNILTQQRAIGPIFNNLYASYGQQGDSQSGLTQSQYQERLASQLVSKQQIEATESFKLTDLKGDELLTQRQQTSSLAVVIVFLMFAITATNFIFVFASISRALRILQEGAFKISEGKLDYRIKYTRTGDEFAVLATTFNSMTASVEQLDRVRSEFVLLVSHQLRTPATAVKGFLSLINDYYAKGLTHKQQNLVNQAYEENDRQLQLINEILAVAQVDSGEMTLNKRPYDVLRLAKSVVAEQQILLDSRDQQANVIQSSVLPEILIDPEKIRIVIENLVHNASKFSPQGSQITVRLSAKEHTVLIEVTDEGPGLERIEVEKLFRKFSRGVSSATARTEGAGLGLYLAKQIVDLHHGKISVRSAVGEGTTFTVQLPNVHHVVKNSEV